MTPFVFKGWTELDGRKLTIRETEVIARTQPDTVRRFGGEFFLSWDNCRARDHFGVMNGDCPTGTLVCRGGMKSAIDPSPPKMPLEESIITAVELRSDEGVTALSGGVDSSFVAALARRECVAVGLEGSHDLRQARHAAGMLGLSCTFVTITPPELETALPAVVAAIPKKDAVSTGIALSQYFIARWAGQHGYGRILTGQGADELFGGYSRYLAAANLANDLARDVAGLKEQVARDQAVAALFGTYFSLPYMDVRVVRAALAIPAEEKIKGSVRKVPLRQVAARHLPRELAFAEKKAMQYGSGVAKVLQKLARENGYKTSIQDYIDRISRVDHGH